MKKTALILSLLLCTAAMFSCGSTDTSNGTGTSQADASVEYQLCHSICTSGLAAAAARMDGSTAKPTRSPSR